MLTVINNFLFLFPPKCFDDCHRHARALNYRQIFFFAKAVILFFETWKSKFLLPCQFSFFCFTHKYINSQSCVIPFSQRFNYGRFWLHTCHSSASSRSAFFNSQKLPLLISGITRNIYYGTNGRGSGDRLLLLTWFCKIKCFFTVRTRN